MKARGFDTLDGALIILKYGGEIIVWIYNTGHKVTDVDSLLDTA
jgi:hypothetical protein